MVLISKKELNLTDDIQVKLASISKENLDKAIENQKHIKVWKIFYYSRGLKIMGYVVEPRKKQGKLPCIIWNRGGTANFGGIVLGQVFSGGIADLALHGYVVIASQYSGGPGSEGVDDWGGENIQDVLVLKKILEKWFGADAKNIGMYGWSRGGMVTYRALSLVKWIKAAVIGAAPTDEVSAPKLRIGWREHQISLYGKSKAEQIKRSALYWSEKIAKKTPILILHGSADWRVPVSNSIRMSEKLYEQKVPFRLVVYEGSDHGISEFRPEVDRLTFEWFDRFLKKKEKLPNLKPHGK